MKATTALLLVLAGVSGYGIHQNWDELSQKLGWRDISPTHTRAVDIAKSDYTLAHHVTNYAYFEAKVEETKGTAVGWSAEKKTESIYLVTFEWTEHREPRKHVFEVHIGHRATRSVTGNEALEAQYGVPAQPR